MHPCGDASDTSTLQRSRLPFSMKRAARAPGYRLGGVTLRDRGTTIFHIVLFLLRRKPDTPARANPSESSACSRARYRESGLRRGGVLPKGDRVAASCLGAVQARKYSSAGPARGHDLQRVARRKAQLAREFRISRTDAAVMRRGLCAPFRCSEVLTPVQARVCRGHETPSWLRKRAERRVGLPADRRQRMRGARSG
jgi:hypothetical protein